MTANTVTHDVSTGLESPRFTLVAPMGFGKTQFINGIVRGSPDVVVLQVICPRVRTAPAVARHMADALVADGLGLPAPI